MRMYPSLYASKAQPLKTKKQASKIAHLSAPLNGLDLSSELAGNSRGSDRKAAVILVNWVLFEDRAQVRPGTNKIATHADHQPIEVLVPYYGTNQQLAAATNGKLVQSDMATLIHGGFGSNDWSWTSFANLGQLAYTIMVNGVDGVWSWDGTATQAGPAVAITAVTAANPAVVTVAAADISKFTNGARVNIVGATGAWAPINGLHTISSVNVPPNTFTMIGVDTTGATGTVNAGVTATSQGSMVKEPVTAPATATWVDPNKFHIVIGHMNRLWFADPINLCVYYLPVQTKSGAVKVLPLNAIFKRGGHIQAIYTWSIDGGMGMDDKLCIFTSNAECAIYAGVDPDSSFNLVGVFRFDMPVSKHCVVNYGGDLFVMISTGLVPMSTLLKAETEDLGIYDKHILSAFQNQSNFRTLPGWQVILDHITGRMICNMPKGSLNQYKQMVRKMPTQNWVEWGDIPARAWGWINGRLFYGDDSGSLYEMAEQYLSDSGTAITADMQLAWSDFGTPAVKHFKMIRPYILSDGVPRPFVDIRLDYDISPPTNQPDATFIGLGSPWDTSPWDVSPWAYGLTMISSWNGVAGFGQVAAPRFTASVTNCHLSVSGFDIIYEPGSLLG